MAVKRVTSSKRDREKAKQSKREEKQKRKEERLSSGSRSFEEMLAYVDENGILHSTPEGVKPKEEIDASVYWLKWMTSDENLADYTEVLPNMFGRQFDLNTDDPLMKKVLEIYDGMEALKSDAQSYDDRTYLLDTVRNALQGIALGNTPETCASEIMEQISANE